MFYLKLISGDDAYVHIDCAHYHVCELVNGVKEVTLYKGFTSENGVTYRVGKHNSEVDGIVHFDSCFVTGCDGKTIDKIC